MEHLYCRPQGSVLDVEAIHAGHYSLVQACDRDKGGPEIAAGIEADWSSQRVYPKVSTIAGSPT